MKKHDTQGYLQKNINPNRFTKECGFINSFRQTPNTKRLGFILKKLMGKKHWCAVTLYDLRSKWSERCRLEAKMCMLDDFLDQDSLNMALQETMFEMMRVRFVNYNHWNNKDGGISYEWRNISPITVKRIISYNTENEWHSETMYIDRNDPFKFSSDGTLFCTRDQMSLI